jgi:hypothetical protein
MNMSTNDYHIEEYKQLIEDRISRIKEIRQLEILVVGGLAAVYAWLASMHTTSLALWSAPILLPAFGLYRALMLRRSVGKLNEYIRKLEAVLNRDTPELEGFETWRAGGSPSGVTKSSFVFWSLLVALAVLAPIVMRKEAKAPPSPTTSTVPPGAAPSASPTGP